MYVSASYFSVIAEQVKLGKVEPEKGEIYTTLQLVNGLALADSAFFNFTHNDIHSTVQTSHMTVEQQVEWATGIAKDARWEYLYTTNEWCPIFQLLKGMDASTFCDLEPEIDGWGVVLDDSLWAVPKGFPREQYYANPKNRYGSEG